MTTQLSCQLTSPELQKRRATVLTDLKARVLEIRETAEGFRYKMPGTDEMVDRVTEFIKTERQCCGFFSFNLTVEGDEGVLWLELSGPPGVKDFIQTELGW